MKREKALPEPATPPHPNIRGCHVYEWERLTRHDITRIAPDAAVLVPLGAIEQHGPYLPTGTDIILASDAVRRAARIAAERSGFSFLIANFLRIGSSDHHLPFGGTISLSPATFLQVVTEAVRSMVHAGVKRIIFINGHGGNTGACHAAAAAVSTTSDLTVAVLDYWSFGEGVFDDAPIPGHAGRWETSAMLATCPEIVLDRQRREPSDANKAPGRGIYGAHIWKSIDGYTDEPALATREEGETILRQIDERLASRLIEVTEEML